VVQQAGQADADLLRDGRHRRAAIALRGERHERGVEQLLAAGTSTRPRLSARLAHAHSLWTRTAAPRRI
jgi:hypothetical protein